MNAPKVEGWKVSRCHEFGSRRKPTAGLRHNGPGAVLSGGAILSGKAAGYFAASASPTYPAAASPSPARTSRSTARAAKSNQSAERMR